ncbi:MAG: nuclear transport factor 2 family protein [Candidatus Theseobacter exili]|nr:nuclear transport factor 2 family protein [Candidatus Theseobacter exili]
MRELKKFLKEKYRKNLWLLQFVFLCCFIFTSSELFPAEILSSDNEERIRNILKLYCKYYSNEDAQSYKSLFTARAQIATIFPNGKLFVLSLDDFIYTQEHYFDEADVSMETFENIRVDLTGNVARVVADYSLVDQDGTSTGKDYFTLIKEDNSWKILFLLFTNDEN